MTGIDDDRGWAAPTMPAFDSEPGSLGGNGAPGWYPDPWATDQHRYWTGEAWTADVFPHGPTFTGPDIRGPGDWGYPTAAPASQPPRPFLSGWRLAAIALAVAVIVGSTAAAITASVDRKTSIKSPASIAGPTTSAPPGTAVPAAPGSSILSGLVVTQADVAPTASVQPLPGGDQTTGPSSATLDLCNGTFASEALRTARLQVVALDAQGTQFLSTEAVLYGKTFDTAQAFAELKSTAAACPATPVPSPTGDPTTATHFNPPPDASWPQTANVERLAFDFTSTDETGKSRHSVAVYLRRGRVLMGVYFFMPDGAQDPVVGQTSIAGTVGVFAQRMAQLPASIVNR